MKTLVVEDDYFSRMVLQKIMQEFGSCDVAVDGAEAVELFIRASESEEPYDLVFLDIMLPEKDGQQVLREIRAFEAARGVLGLDGVKIVMTTALGDSKNVLAAFNAQCEGYIVKPYNKKKIIEQLTELGIIA